MTPSVEAMVPVAGGRLWAEWAGEGSGVVLLHAGIADARQWDPQWAALAARHRVVRYDLRGFGRADVEHVGFSNRDDLLAVMDAAGLERAVLVGASRAGAIALDTALERPDRVAGLAWVCGGIAGLDEDETPEEQALSAREEALSEARDWAALADFDVEVWIDGVGRPDAAPAAVRDLVWRMTHDTYVQDKPYGDPVPLEPPAPARLGELRIPVLAVVGTYDRPSVAHAASLLETAVPGLRRVDLPTAHLPNLELADAFTELLLGFLADVDRGAP